MKYVQDDKKTWTHALALRRVGRAAGALQEIHPASAAWLSIGGPAGGRDRVVGGQAHQPHLPYDVFGFDLQLGVFASQPSTLQRQVDFGDSQFLLQLSAEILQSFTQFGGSLIELLPIGNPSRLIL